MPASLSCGESARGGRSGFASAGTGGASQSAGFGGASGGAPSAAGRGTSNAGTPSGGVSASGGTGAASGGANGVEGAGRSSSAGASGGGASGGTSGGAAARAGTGGIPQGGTDDGGASEAGAPSCVVGGPAQTCNGVEVYNSAVVDFGRFSTDGKWSTNEGLTGGTSFYQSPSTPSVMLEAVPSSSLRAHVTLPPKSYAGWTFVFDQCTNVTITRGFGLTLSGELGGARLTASVEIDADYPIDAQSGKGACSFTSCETMQSECKAPSLELMPMPPPYDDRLVKFGDFTGGIPVDTPLRDDPDSLRAVRGLQFELTCQGDTECAVDLLFGTPSYVPAV